MNARRRPSARFAALLAGLAAAIAAIAAPGPLAGRSALDAAIAADSAPTRFADPVEAGAEALRDSGDYPWYDSEQDAFRPVPVRSTAPDARNRSSTWTETERAAGPQWDLSGFGDILGFLVYTVLTLLVVAVIALIVRALLKLRGADDPTAEGELADEVEKRGDVDRIEALPFPVLRQRGDLLEAARQAYLAGRYDDAVVCLFSYFLVRLDRAQLLRLARGKTNRQYLREVGAHSRAGQILAPTMLAFEDVYFGAHRLDQARFESCWNRLDEFHAVVDQEAS